MDAQAGLDSLLGRLSAILVNEAQLLGGVRGDVEFIKDEMECMNSLILQLTEAQHRDHLVRAWMRQVVGLTRDCEGNVELYIHYIVSAPGGDGLMGYLRRIPRFLRTILVRHRIATRIRELKVHARDVGDRRQRYGVTVPPAPATAGANWYDGDIEPAGDEEDLRRRAVLFDGVEPPLDLAEVSEQGINSLIKWLSTEPAPATGATGDYIEQRLRIFSIVDGDNYRGGYIADQVYEHSSIATLFGCKAFVSYREDARTTLGEILGALTDQSAFETSRWVHMDEEQLASKLQDNLKGNRFLIVIVIIQDVEDQQGWKRTLHALLHAADGCKPGSAIIVTTTDDDVALSFSPYKIINSRTLDEFYNKKAGKLGVRGYPSHTDDFYDFSAFARKMLLHLWYANPVTTQDEAGMYGTAISKCKGLKKSIAQIMVTWCYNELPSKYKSCLLYLAVFPQGYVIKTTTLSRRWIAEGLITATTRSNETESAADEAERYWDVLFTRGFISPVEISAAGNIKSCTLHHEVHKVIAKISKDVNIIETNLPKDWARHLSIHNRIVLQKPHSGGDSKDFTASLPSLAASTQWQLLKVLDLEGCQGLEKNHLKSICKVLLLKYLSLRNTDVTELPKQIKELQCLETLDIRQTKVRRLAKKPIVLPLLKHFLAGHKISASNDPMTSEESVGTVSVPLCIQKMENIEILSHVQVNDDSELFGIAQLEKLRKLGIALQGKNIKLSDMFCHIKKLHRCLRSFSIRISQTAGSSDNNDAEEVHALPSVPQFIERLNICGITSGLVYSIKEHHHLTKITLRETYLKEDDLCILGNLGGLRGLKLQHKSYTESELTFKKCEFLSLNYLLVEGEEITKIRFDIGAAPKLEWIVWSFATMDALSGVDWLPKLKKLKLNGDCDPDPIKDALEGHPNYAVLEHKPRQQCHTE